MIKTKIAFEDIKAGDLLEMVSREDGIKYVTTGIAFALSTKAHAGEPVWYTSEQGRLVASWDADTIYRIDVSEVTFDDIQWGDLIEVSAKRGDVERLIRGRAVNFIRSDASWYDGWATEDGSVMIRRRNTDKIVVLERGGK